MFILIALSLLCGRSFFCVVVGVETTEKKNNTQKRCHRKFEDSRLFPIRKNENARSMENSRMYWISINCDASEKLSNTTELKVKNFKVREKLFVKSENFQEKWP